MAADIALQFCAAQNVFGASTTVPSTDWIDGKVAKDWAGGDKPTAEILVTTTFVGGTSVRFQLTAVDAAGANPAVIAQTREYLIAELVQPAAGTPQKGGTIIHLSMEPLMALPAATLTHLRLQAVNTGTTTAGAITAHLLPDVGTCHPLKAYAAGF